jgi:hypothetical protein
MPGGNGGNRPAFGGANRPVLETLAQHMVEQHFIPKRTPIEDLFVVGD